MRLWHYELLEFLPRSQLIAQWRELNSIFKKQDKHILINYVYEYDRVHLLAYSLMVMSEMNKRGYRINSTKNFDEYFASTRLMSVANDKNFKPFPYHHTKRYLVQCFYNLQEKFDRGQEDFDGETFEKLKNFMDFKRNINNQRFFACLEHKDGKVDRIMFDNREDARSFILMRFNQNVHTRCWTE